MEITSFVLGMLSVVFLMGIIVGVFGARKITKLENETNSLTREIEECHRHISEVSESDNRRIDDVHNYIDSRFEHLSRDLDSRFDKLENRLKTDVKSKQLLKD